MARNGKAMKKKMIGTTLAVIAALAIAIPGRAQSSASAGSGQNKSSSGTSASTGSRAQQTPQTREAMKRAQEALDAAEKALGGNGINLGELSIQLGNLNGLPEPGALAELGNLAELGYLANLESLGNLNAVNLAALAQFQEGVSGGASFGIGGGIGGGVSGGIPAGVYAFGAASEQEDREAELYNEGTSAMDDGKWDRALDKFSQVAEMHGKKADAAVYYKARALYKLGRRDEALNTLTGLEKDYPKSRWLNDAKELEIEIKQKSGQQISPDSQSDCELKLYALNGLQQADPDKAVPLLEKMLHGSDCPKLSSQAFFILAQSGSQQARDVIIKLAKGDSTNPDMQRKAIQALGMYGGSYGRDALSQVFTSSNDVDTKKAVLRALMMSGDRERILAAAKGEKLPEVRSEAIRQLGMMGAKDAIWQLYQTETSVEVKTQILQAMWMAGDRQHVGELAMKETDHNLRLKAINDLGLMGKESDSILVNIYKSDPDPEVRKKVINALFLAGDAKGLVDLARSETNPELKKTIVSQLSLMHSKEATDYLMELLNK